MSKNSATAFVRKLREEKGFASSIKAEIASAGPKNRHEVVARHGFEFTDDELKEALAEVGASPASELSEEELETVAGGSLQFQGSFYTLQSVDGTKLNFGFGGGGGTMQHATYW